MPSLKAALLLVITMLVLPACAPRAVIAPISPDTPPDEVFKMVRQAEEGISGLRAFVKVRIVEDGGEPKSFDGVLYAARPGKVRLTGLALLGYTVFDAVVTKEKFYFYEHSFGYLYTGPRQRLGPFLKDMGVNVDPDVLYMSLFNDAETGPGGFLYEKTSDGYGFYLVEKDGQGGDAPDASGVMRPKMKVEYDLGLNLKQKIFYDELSRPYLYVRSEGHVEADGFRMPERLIATDTSGGYTLTVTFNKYIINPEGSESDFTIQGGELKGVREVE